MLQSSQAICPLCRKTDDIRKVSTIVTQTTSISSRSYHQIASQNLLTHYLKPPSPPPFKSTGTASWSFLLIVLFMVCIWLVLGFLILDVFVAWTDGLHSTSSLSIVLADGYPMELLFHVLLGMEFLVLLLCLWHAYRGAARKAKQASLQRESDERSGRWKQAMDRWNTLYYCYRDDVVFLPGQPQKFAQPASMNTLL